MKALNYKVLFFIFAIILLTGILYLVYQSSNKKEVMHENTTSNSEDIIYLKLKNGVVVIETFPNIAPNHVARIKELVRSGFYNGNKFFRVIEGFVAQGGDPTNTGTSGSGKKLKAEFSNISHKRGIMSMARTNDPNSADSQFFIVLEDSEFLDGKYTVWGRVISGMEFVDDIKKSKTGSNGFVEDADSIIAMAIKKDVEDTADSRNKFFNK